MFVTLTWANISTYGHCDMRQSIYDYIVGFLFAATLFVFMFTRPGFFNGHVYVRVYDIADDVSLLASA